MRFGYLLKQFETDDGAQRVSLDTLDDLLRLMATERCAEARVLCKGPGMPVLIELPATAAAQRRVTADIDMRIAKRMDLNRMAKHLQPLSPEEWMSEEQSRALSGNRRHQLAVLRHTKGPPVWPGLSAALSRVK
jgi:hypothetical protein